MVERRDQLVAMRVQENNRLEIARTEAIKKSIKNNLQFLDKQIEEFESQMISYTKEDEKINFALSLFQSVPGIGWLTAIKLIVDFVMLSASCKDCS